VKSTEEAQCRRIRQESQESRVKSQEESLMSAASLRAEEISRQTKAPRVRDSTGIRVARESAIVNTVCVWKLFVTERL
jgi:ppGpp synthetase/RelA/SpoT-type nucleotidyltranferase